MPNNERSFAWPARLTEDEDGRVVLSKEKAELLKVWDEISKAYEAEESVEGTIVARVKGGLSVDIGVKAFLPGSQVDLRPVRNLDGMIGDELDDLLSDRPTVKRIGCRLDARDGRLRLVPLVDECEQLRVRRAAPERAGMCATSVSPRLVEARQVGPDGLVMISTGCIVHN